MESSEDDAGAAANASRRASAREKDLGPSELDATANTRDASGAQTPCESGAMSEDNFDGDSVPSPSQDHNTSTEAILDMIDEIVDGPGAPKRLPLPSEDHVEPDPEASVPAAPAPAAPSEPSPPVQGSNTSQEEPKDLPKPGQDANTSQILEEVPVPPVLNPASANYESEHHESLPDTPIVCISDSAAPIEVANSNTEPSQASSSVPEVCTEPTEVKSDPPVQQNVQLEAASTCPGPNIPSSSVEETVPSTCEISECETNDRTVKHVTSSDNRDNVTVESAESTSSDASISEGRPTVQESSTRSPLRRRLIRPTLYDRRPDTTVSSTVDSRASDNEVTEQTISDSVTKDVSSSSDIVLSVHGNVDETNSNVSEEISVCKAETSTNPPKKIKLIRQKLTASTSQCQKSSEQQKIPESEIPSTSSPSLPITRSEYSSSECISTTDSGVDVSVEPNQDCPSENPNSEPITKPIEEFFSEKPLLSETSESPLQPSAKLVLHLPNASENVEIQKKVPPIKVNLNVSKAAEPVNDTNTEVEVQSQQKGESTHSSPSDPEFPESSKQIPKLTIKLGTIQPEEIKSPIPKLTIKPIKPPSEQEGKVDKIDSEPIPNITKLNIKPIPRLPEKINDIHRKSSSSEISESECSENDETSASDQASASDQGATEVIPKVTIKLGKPGTESEGKFYTEKNVPKKSENEECESVSKLKVVVGQSDENQLDKIPKLTIKTVTKSDSQLSPKLTIKPIKPVDSVGKESMADQCDSEVNKNKVSSDSPESSGEVKETAHVPKITIKPVLKSDLESSIKTPKKSGTSEGSENIPVVTKLNIKPIMKPIDGGETSGEGEEKVPVVSKLNIKPILKPKDSEIDPSIEDIPKVTKLNIKPLKNPEEKSSEQKDCDEWNADSDENSIPVVTKLNIKPIFKPNEEENIKDSENQSSETGNSSDDNTDIPVVTKLNIKPIMKPSNLEENTSSTSAEPSIPIVTKLNIKPIVKPEENALPSSPKKEIPVVTKLNIKPVLKPDDDQSKIKEDINDTPSKNPPLVMKINMKVVGETTCNENVKTDDKINNIDEKVEHLYNNINENIPVVSKINIKPITKPTDEVKTRSEIKNDTSTTDGCNETKGTSAGQTAANCLTEAVDIPVLEKDDTVVNIETKSGGSHKILKDNCLSEESGSINSYHSNDLDHSKLEKDNLVSASNKNEQDTFKSNVDSVTIPSPVKQTTLSNCTLLKKLLENKIKDVDTMVKEPELSESNIHDITPLTSSTHSSDEIDKVNSKVDSKKHKSTLDTKETPLSSSLNIQVQNINRVENESVTKPLEINISEKSTSQSSGQDSPRIILKINKTDHGPSAKIITEEIKKPEPDHDSYSPENTQEINDTQKRALLNMRKKLATNLTPTVALGKRLRSSRIVQKPEKSPAKRNPGKRPPSVDTSPPQSKGAELSVLETKRLKLGQLLSNKSLTVTPVSVKTQNTSPAIKLELDSKQNVKTVNHSLLNNENCSKNGNSKLHNILSNLQAKQMQGLALNDINHVEKAKTIIPELDTSTSTGSSDVVEIIPMDNAHPKVQEMIINENSESHDFNMINDDLSQDPLEVDHLKTEASSDSVSVPFTPQPKKRGRPRKIPLSEGAKGLPTPALEERPQRSLRLTRDRPAILAKPRGRGRGRGFKRAVSTSPKEPESTVEIATKFFIKEKTPEEEIDPTSSRVKLPLMTEALDKMPSACTTPLSSRKRESSSSTETKYPDTQELKVVLENTLPKMEESLMRSPKTPAGERGRGRGRGGRGRGRGGAGPKTPRARGRGRGGGRGAMYMKETMGIYGRVCGPATTTVHLFEEETCMMDDNATPAKPSSSHLLDEDSQSSVKSSTNESSKMRKSKFADLFDSNKVWTAADVKEYMWPPPENPSPCDEHQVMMIQEQVAMFLGVKSFKRRYPELKRRSVGGEERDYILRKGLVTEALCDLGITAVEASEVLDIMLSDYPHKYEEYRSHQRARQAAAAAAAAPEPGAQPEPRADRVEMKLERGDAKPEVPKVDPEKARQDMAAAAIASASEWNTRLNTSRRGACADLQTMTVQRRRPPPRPPAHHVRPPAGFYPHALLPGQYQHSYRVYTPAQLRYFPLNTALAAPPAPPSSESESESEPDWGSCSSSDTERHPPAKRKKLTKVKRSSAEVKEERDEEVCRACRLREEGNRKYSHERFLVCANCNGRLHPSCVELPADTIRKVREYAWQCAECKTCGACALPADDDKMLFCDLCDRGFHIYCVGLERVPSGRWHCVECAICKSCGAREPGGLAGGDGEWQHQTRRGPGGHKLYSHSLCAPCARAYRIGRYCPLCARSFIGPKGTMQLVICKLCDRQLHQECVRQAGGGGGGGAGAGAGALNVLDYTCGECRRSGITSRSAAARLAPRTIATLFMAKRRFNKYAHRQYLASRQRSTDNDHDDSRDAPDPHDASGTLESPEATHSAAPAEH